MLWVAHLFRVEEPNDGCVFVSSMFLFFLSLVLIHVLHCCCGSRTLARFGGNHRCFYACSVSSGDFRARRSPLFLGFLYLSLSLPAPPFLSNVYGTRNTHVAAVRLSPPWLRRERHIPLFEKTVGTPCVGQSVPTKDEARGVAVPGRPVSSHQVTTLVAITPTLVYRTRLKDTIPTFCVCCVRVVLEDTFPPFVCSVFRALGR